MSRDLEVLLLPVCSGRELILPHAWLEGFPLSGDFFGYGTGDAWRQGSPPVIPALRDWPQGSFVCSCRRRH